jgi:ABC-type transporter Mla subunit MlaD
VRAVAEGKPTFFEALRDLLKNIGEDAKTIGDILSSSFGAAGSALGGMTTALAQFASQQTTIAEQLDKTLKNPAVAKDSTKQAAAIKEANDKSLRSTVSMYASMASSAKGFFKENSRPATKRWRRSARRSAQSNSRSRCRAS